MTSDCYKYAGTLSRLVDSWVKAGALYYGLVGPRLGKRRISVQKGDVYFSLKGEHILTLDTTLPTLFEGTLT